MSVYECLRYSPTFKKFMCFSSILISKMLFMTLLTIRQRLKKGVFSNPEDGTYRKIQIKFDDQDIERIRRTHRNDVENIPLFIFVAFFYCLTDPNEGEATVLFALFTITRIIHTIVYAIYVIPQPARVFAFFTGYIVTVYMLIRVLMFTF